MNVKNLPFPTLTESLLFGVGSIAGFIIPGIALNLVADAASKVQLNDMLSSNAKQLKQGNLSTKSLAGILVFVGGTAISLYALDKATRLLKIFGYGFIFGLLTKFVVIPFIFPVFGFPGVSPPDLTSVSNTTTNATTLG